MSPLPLEHSFQAPVALQAPAPDLPRLIDDRRAPSFREAFGVLARRSTALDVALTHIRLSTLDLTDGELGRMERIRLLLAEVSAASLDAEAHAILHHAGMAAHLTRLTRLLDDGRIEVRSAPLGGWAPDFSIFRAEDGPFAALVGPHRFDRGMSHEGPVLASVHPRADAAQLAPRFGELWSRGHDIRGAVAGILARARDRAARPTAPADETPTATTTSAGPPARDSVDTPGHPG